MGNSVSSVPNLASPSFVSLVEQHRGSDGTLNVLEVAQAYLKAYPNENYLSDSILGMCEAYIFFKRGEEIDSAQAWYLTTRGVPRIVLQYILEFDGPEFQVWLNTNADLFQGFEDF